jgi:PPM family protein phosphatase
MRFLIYQDSRQGPRKSNQDRLAYSYSRDALFLVVADGMGGHLHGEIAAHIAVQFLIEAFQKQARPQLEDPHRFLIDAITNAHLAIVSYAEGKQLLETPRTTCVACVIQNGAGYWAHVGDSRLYLIRDGRVESVTKDHSRVQQLIDMGRVREEAAANHPDRNKVFNCLGQINLPRIDISRRVVLRNNDTLILCSDGMWGPISSRTIIEALLRQDILRAMPELMNAAETRAGAEGDNLSAIAVTWLEEGVSEDDSPDTISTKTMTLDEVATQTAGFGEGPAREHLSDDEIERAIEEIRGAIKKASR